MRIFILTFLLLFSVPSFAYECAIEKEKIITDLKKDVQCSNDDECGYFDYGYPWQPDKCVKAIVNIHNESHNISNLRLIEEYNTNCIYNDAAQKKEYDTFAASLEKAQCDIPRTYCYKGFCRIKNYAIYNDK